MNEELNVWDTFAPELQSALSRVGKFVSEDTLAEIAAIVDRDLFESEPFDPEIVPDRGVYGIDERGHWYDIEPIEFHSPSNY